MSRDENLLIFFKSERSALCTFFIYVLQAPLILQLTADITRPYLQPSHESRLRGVTSFAEVRDGRRLPRENQCAHILQLTICAGVEEW